MLTNRHIRITIALFVSMALHAALMIGGTSIKLPGSILQQQKKTVTMTLAPRPVPKPRVAVKKQAQHPEPVVKKFIREIPTPLPVLPEEQKQVDAPEKTVPEKTETKNNQNFTDDFAASGDTNIIKATPLYKVNPPPHYPSTARRRGYQGTVILEVMVSESGTVQEVKMFESSGYGVLDKAAIKAVKSWSFAPASRMGVPIAMWVKIPVQFILR